MRGVARFAGVHLYNEDGDVLYATPELLSVHRVSGGKRRFKLLGQAEVVYDLFNECIVDRQTAEFEVELPRPQQPCTLRGMRLCWLGETAKNSAPTSEVFFKRYTVSPASDVFL